MRVFAEHIEAPNWTADGSLIYNSGGKLHRILATGGEPTTIESGFANRCNNDHGLSPDGKWIAISDQSQGNHQSAIYTLPVTGGEPKKITDGSPSYWHGWSPDGKTLAFCGQRDGKFGIFTVPAAGGAETRLTSRRWPRRRPGLLAGRQAHLLQLGPVRPDANLSDEPGWIGNRSSDEG